LSVLGRKIHANAEGHSEELANPPKVEDKLGAVPHGLSTDSDVAKRFVRAPDFSEFFPLFFIYSSLYVLFSNLRYMSSGKPSQCRRKHSAVMRRSMSSRLRFLGLWISSSTRFTVIPQRTYLQCFRCKDYDRNDACPLSYP